MKEAESKALETAALLYNAVPGYILENKSKGDMNHLLIELIDALDTIEYQRTGSPLFDILGTISSLRKKAILDLEKQYGLTERESLVLRYLANERNPSYIASHLGIAQATAKAHKYSIFKKMGVHSSDELKALLAEHNINPSE